jgi:hypothetical protein
MDFCKEFNSFRAAIAQSVWRWATDWTVGVLGFDSRRGLGIFLFTTVPTTAMEPTQLPVQWVPGALSRGVKRPGREADHSPPSSAEVNNVWSYTSTPQYVFMAWCLIKHRENFTFIYLFLSEVMTLDFLQSKNFGICLCDFLCPKYTVRYFNTVPVCS